MGVSDECQFLNHIFKHLNTLDLDQMDEDKKFDVGHPMCNATGSTQYRYYGSMPIGESCPRVLQRCGELRESIWS